MSDDGPTQPPDNIPATPDELAALYLRGRDVPCPGCGYNLRDGTSAVCPECTHHFTLHAADYKLSAPRRAVLTCCVLSGALLGLVCSYVLIGESVSGSGNFGPWYDYTTLTLAFLTLGLHALTLMGLRSVFGKRIDTLRSVVRITAILAVNFWLTASALILIVVDHWL
ncbi:MAG: hypothetical protein AAGA55_10905 [Planctomycetota bacterium]